MTEPQPEEVAMHPTATTLQEPVSRGRGPLTRAAAAVGGLAVLLTGSATGLTHYWTPAAPIALTSTTTSAASLRVSGVTATALSAVARTGGQQ